MTITDEMTGSKQVAPSAHTYAGPEAERKKLAYLECLAREHARFEKPGIIGEFGWHGGGKPRALKDAPPATEEQQARWCRLVVESTRGHATGWLNWGFHDQPEATDVSQFTGLLTAEGREKAWGREFRRLAAELKDGRFPVPAPANRPAIDWDRLVTSRKAIDEFRAQYLRSYPDSPAP